jgi:hypothetical protein
VVGVFLVLLGCLVHYSQEARVYSLLALLAALSFFIGLLDGVRTGAVVGYVATAALLYAHTYRLFVLAAQIGFAFVALLWRRDWIPCEGRIPAILSESRTAGAEADFVGIRVTPHD